MIYVTNQSFFCDICLSENLKRGMKKLIVSFVFCFCSFFCLTSFCQTNGWSLHVGKNTPIGSFAKTGTAFLENNTGKGAAKTGFNLGLKWQTSLRIPVLRRLKFMTTFDIMYNGLADSAKDMIESQNNPSDFFTASAPSYYNLPIMAGANFHTNFFGVFKVYVEMGLGMNYRIVSDMNRVFSIEADDGSKTDFSGRIDFDNTSAFAIQFGIGMSLFNRLSLGISYYNLGKSELKGSLVSIESRELLFESIADEYKEFSNGKIGSSMFVLRFGWHF